MAGQRSTNGSHFHAYLHAELQKGTGDLARLRDPETSSCPQHSHVDGHPLLLSKWLFPHEEVATPNVNNVVQMPKVANAT